MNIEKIWDNWNDRDKFSGVFSVIGEHGILFEKCCGFRNRSERLPNNKATALGNTEINAYPLLESIINEVD